MNQQVKNTIPVYDIGALAGTNHLRGDITAEGLAHYLARHKGLKFPHRHSFYHLLYFTQGSGYHTIDFERFDVVPGQIYFMAPAQVHSWFFGADVDGYIINFSEQLLHALFRDDMHPSRFPFFMGDVADCVLHLAEGRTEAEQLLAQIVAETTDGRPMATEMICLNLMKLLVLVAREVPDRPERYAHHNYVVLHNFRQLVEQHYTRLHLPKEYAAMLYITPNHLNALCQDMLGRQAGEVIRDRVLLEAKRLLAGHSIGVAEIAWQLNFSDNSYFTKFFKKYTGLTPEQFRKQVGNT